VTDFTGSSRDVGIVPPDTSFLRYSVQVWPGDLNNDGVVNVVDLLPVGYFYGKTGPARQVANCLWAGDTAQLWGFDRSDTTKSAYQDFADANGDGRVTTGDYQCLYRNLDSLHALHLLPHGSTNASNLARSVDPPLQAFTVETQIDSSQLPYLLNVSINLGSIATPANSVLGVAYDIYFDSECVDLT